ncbi:PcfJ domain-containing protein [uncultured Thiohalocapsa sp.]|uniref:PcfJ domain-containing protein n=1 Tax=uncultured Thiohalocapsa sp. TaxID=768990 RepID=UPI0025E7EAC6|nr:PcfJ domain-containing protein [uncultured Thiohalocapsa sp.]
MPADRLDARFKQDTLYVFKAEETQLIKAWPDLTAVRKHDRNARWLDFEPDYPLIRPYRPRRKPKPKAPPAGAPQQLALDLVLPPDAPPLPPTRPRLTPAQRRKRAFDAFRFSCPKPVARRIEPFRGDHLPLLRLLRALGEERADLLDTSPALGYCLALAFRESLAARAPERHQRLDQLVGRKQAEIMDRLGLPQSKRAVRAMAKIRPGAMSRELVGGLKRLLADDEALQVMGHLPALNLGALTLLLDPQLRALATPVLFEAIVEEPQEGHFPFTARRLADIQQMADALGVDISRRRFRERRRLDGLFQDLARDYTRLEDGRLQSCRFPPPPLPGTDAIVPLRAPQALVEEGRRQHNCVAGYAERVAGGDTYIYRVLAPQRATLSLVRWPGGRWQIGELLLAGNHPVSAATRRTVEGWLDTHRL